MSPFQRGAAVLATATMVSGVPRAACAVGPGPAASSGGTGTGSTMSSPPGSPDERPIRIRYTGHEGCPDALGFFWYIRARTQRVRLASPGEPADLATVSIVPVDGQSVGTLELPPMEGGRPFSRQVAASSCGEVVLALSLVLALNYDPDATTTFPSIVTAPQQEPLVQQPGAAQQPPPVVALPAPSPPIVEQSPVEPRRPRPDYNAAAGLTALAVSAIGPSTFEPVLAPFFEYGSNRDQLWQPRARASFLVQVPAADAQTSAGTATLLFLSAQLSGCPISARLIEPLALSPCLGVDVGQILGKASTNVTGTRQSGNLWWVALEAIVRLRSTLAGPLFAEVTGSGGYSIAPGQFVLIGTQGDRVSAHNLPKFFGSFGLGLGVHFP